MQKLNIPKKAWPLLVHLLTIILYGVSLVYFFKLANFFVKNKTIANWAMAAYGLYPSVIFYVGSLFCFENIVTSLLVIVLYKIIQIFCLNQEIKIKDYMSILFIVAFSCLIRPSSILVFIPIFIALFVFLIKDYFKIKILGMKKLWLIFSVGIFTFMCHLPFLIKNYNMFGHYIINTQTGFSFLYGHNPYARGSWDGDTQKKGNNIYNYIHNNIPDIEKIDQFQESQACKKIALNWILHNPGKETKLIFRKLAIYFLPQNFFVLPGNRLWNPVNLLFHLLFFSYIFSLVFKRRFPSRAEVLILLPILGSVLTSVIFIVCYRWRYYAEPFMVLTAFIFLNNFLHLPFGLSLLAICRKADKRGRYG